MAYYEKKNKEYIIETELPSGARFFVFGGTYKFGKDKYARLTSRANEAKRYGRKGVAISAGNRLIKNCINIKSFQIQEVT